MNSSDSVKFLEALFSPGEGFCYSTTVDRPGEVVTLEQAIELPPRNFISVNPLLPIDIKTGSAPPRRKDCNVSEHRAWVIEMDKDPRTNAPITLDDQLKELEDKKCPYTTLTYSGGKSVHAVISIDEKVTPAEYQEIFENLSYIFWRLDRSCKNPSRLTRVAGADRGTEEQSLIDIKKCIAKAELFCWIKRFDKHIQKCKDRTKKQIQSYKQATVEAANQAGLTPWASAFLAGTASCRSSRHNAIVAVARMLASRGDSADRVYDQILRCADAHGLLNEGRLEEVEHIIEFALRAEGVES